MKRCVYYIIFLSIILYSEVLGDEEIDDTTILSMKAMINNPALARFDSEIEIGELVNLPARVNATRGPIVIGECEAMTNCQAVIVILQTGKCFAINLPPFSNCHEERCAEISKTKNVYEIFKNKGICMNVKDDEDGILQNGRRLTGICFCDSG